MGKQIFRNPIFYLFLAIVGSYAFRFAQGDRLEGVFESDTRGYYGYLPALLIFNDTSHEKSHAAEIKNGMNPDLPQFHLSLTKSGDKIIRCFSGVATLQLPFFGMACLTAWVFQQDVDGYGFIFRLFFHIGGVFYFLLALLLARRFLNQFFVETKKWNGFYFILLVFASTIWFYSYQTPGFSHVYSFFLFTAFANSVLALKKKKSNWNFCLLAISLGFIALVRPTNLVVVLLIPFLLQSKEETLLFFRALFSNRAQALLFGSLCFVSIGSIQLFLWKWQTGNWIATAYAGEGFQFFHAYFIETLFSFRIGLFLHTPILILSVVASFFYFRNRSFQALFFVLYALVNTWIISSWWCWDYESPFGNRAFTEHFFFLSLPLFYFLYRFPKTTLFWSIFFLVIQNIRYYEQVSGIMPNQRFTAENYLPSLAFWKKENVERWNFTLSCKPYGKKMSRQVLVYTDDTEIEILPTDPYSVTSNMAFKTNRTDERYYFEISMDKYSEEADLSSVSLVLDAYESNHTSNFFAIYELSNDRVSERGKWTNLHFQGTIPDNFQQYDSLKIFIYNPKGKKLKLKNVRYLMDEYKSN